MASSSAAGQLTSYQAPSLRELLRKRILIDTIRPIEGWKLLITDGPALRILSSACKMSDVLDENVTRTRKCSL